MLKLIFMQKNPDFSWRKSGFLLIFAPEIVYYKSITKLIMQQKNYIHQVSRLAVQLKI